jgi:hypothetical protein
MNLDYQRRMALAQDALGGLKGPDLGALDVELDEVGNETDVIRPVVKMQLGWSVADGRFDRFDQAREPRVEPEALVHGLQARAVAFECRDAGAGALCDRKRVVSVLRTDVICGHARAQKPPEMPVQLDLVESEVKPRLGGEVDPHADATSDPCDYRASRRPLGQKHSPDRAPDTRPHLRPDHQ